MRSLLEQVEKIDDYTVRDGYGCVGKLMVGLEVKDKDGKILFDKTWEARSFNRNFGRLMQSIFDFVNPTLVDIQNNNIILRMGADGGAAPARLVPRPNSVCNVFSGDSVAQGKFSGGAKFGIGIGALTGNDSTFIELESKFGEVDAQKATSITQEDTAALVYVITQGFTVVLAAGIDLTEIGLYGRFRVQNDFNGESGPVFQFLLAYDQVNPLVHIPQGGVVSPKYTISWIA
jgi:hypothetical protein